MGKNGQNRSSTWVAWFSGAKEKRSYFILPYPSAEYLEGARYLTLENTYAQDEVGSTPKRPSASTQLLVFQVHKTVCYNAELPIPLDFSTTIMAN